MRPGGGWRLVLAAVVLGLVLANARDCGDGRVSFDPDRSTAPTTREVP